VTDVLELFCGAGGASLGVHAAGYTSVGVELDADCVKTRDAAGMETVQGDVSALDPMQWRGIDGLWASPPCQAFSRAGKRKGLADPRGQLVWQVPRYVEALRPRWVVCEQVPDVLSIWQQIAHQFRQDGYRAWTGLLSSEQYGTAQTRSRAYLIARRDGLPASPPVATHQRYEHGIPQGDPTACNVGGLWGDELLPWVSMADALGWGMTARPALSVAVGTESGGADTSCVGGSGARASLHRERDEGRWMYHNKNRAPAFGDRRDHPVEEPAPTITSKARSDTWVASTGWQMRGAGRTGLVQRDVDEPASTMTGAGNAVWFHDRPATTIACDSRVFQPGGHHTPGAQSENSIRVAVQEAAVLQDFPADYPFQGSRTSQYRQVGNAVPSKVACAAVTAASRTIEVAA
jgi:DNA (cytosine-5)-methyltransferase 1